MPRSTLPMTIALLVSASPVLAGETFTASAPDGFVLAREAVDPLSKRSMVEHVPDGQSVWEWSEKVMIQELPKTRAPKGYTASVARSFAGGCGGAETSVLFEGAQNGADVSVILATCPADDDGAPSAFMLKAVDGADSTFVVEWAWKGALPDAGQQAAASAYLDGAVLCDGATASCPSG